MGALLLFVIIVMIIGFVTTRYIRKKYNIVSYFPYRHMNEFHKWGERILLSLAIIFYLVAFIFNVNYVEFYYLGILFLFILLQGFRTYMEYKHEPEEREYVLNFVWMICAVIIFVGCIVFLFHTKSFEDIDNEHRSTNSDYRKSVRITNYLSDEIENEGLIGVDNRNEITVEDPQVIDQIVDELMALEVRHFVGDHANDNDHFHIYIRADRTYSVYLYENYINAEKGTYGIVGNNELYKLLLEEQSEWVDIEE